MIDHAKHAEFAPLLWRPRVIQPQQTLSVVLTVHNAEKTLADQVSKTLDILTDLSARFELLIVDDGSTDQTEEVAHELARHFPQLRVARHARRWAAMRPRGRRWNKRRETSSSSTKRKLRCLRTSYAASGS